MLMRVLLFQLLSLSQQYALFSSRHVILCVCVCNCMFAKFRGQLSFFTVQCVIFKAVNRGSVWVFNKGPKKTG